MEQRCAMGVQASSAVPAHQRVLMARGPHRFCYQGCDLYNHHSFLLMGLFSTIVAAISTPFEITIAMIILFRLQAESDTEVLEILDLYRQVYEDLLAIPVVKGKKVPLNSYVSNNLERLLKMIPSGRRKRRSLPEATTPPLLKHLCLLVDVVFRSSNSESIAC
jgi:hypothetical protein